MYVVSFVFPSTFKYIQQWDMERCNDLLFLVAKYLHPDKNTFLMINSTVIFLINKTFLPQCDTGETIKQFLRLSDNKIEEMFHSSKNPIVIRDLDINKILMSDASTNGKNKKS